MYVKVYSNSLIYNLHKWLLIFGLLVQTNDRKTKKSLLQFEDYQFFKVLDHLVDSGIWIKFTPTVILANFLFDLQFCQILSSIFHCRLISIISSSENTTANPNICTAHLNSFFKVIGHAHWEFNFLHRKAKFRWNPSARKKGIISLPR